jgi:hypothetical protein
MTLIPAHDAIMIADSDDLEGDCIGEQERQWLVGTGKGMLHMHSFPSWLWCCARARMLLPNWPRFLWVEDKWQEQKGQAVAVRRRAAGWEEKWKRERGKEQRVRCTAVSGTQQHKASFLVRKKREPW